MNGSNRILGFFGATLTMLPCLVLALSNIISPPGNNVHPETVSWTNTLAGFYVIYTVITAIGLTGSLLPDKQYKLGGVLMLISGILMVILAFPWYFKLTPLLLVAAGIRTLSSENNPPKTDTPQDEDKTYLEE